MVFLHSWWSVCFGHQFLHEYFCAHEVSWCILLVIIPWLGLISSLILLCVEHSMQHSGSMSTFSHCVFMVVNGCCIYPCHSASRSLHGYLSTLMLHVWIPLMIFLFLWLFLSPLIPMKIISVKEYQFLGKHSAWYNGMVV